LTLENQLSKKQVEIDNLRLKAAKASRNEIDAGARLAGQLTATRDTLTPIEQSITKALNEQKTISDQILSINNEDLQLTSLINSQIEQGANFTQTQVESVKKLKRTYEELIPILDQALERASIERLDVFSQGVESPITASSGRAETQGINTTNISDQVTSLKALELQLQGTGLSVSQFYEAIANGAAEGFDSLDKFITRLASTQQLIDDSFAVLESGIENTIGDISFAIGDALANGTNALEAGGAALLGGLASILNQLGQLAIATGIGIEGIKTALKTLNPAVAIGAGVALVALAGFVSAKAKSLGGVGGSSSGASGVGVSGVGSSFTGTGGTGFSAERNINLVGSFRIAGSDLLYVIDQSNQARI
jgi:hypothetical protein